MANYPDNLNPTSLIIPSMPEAKQTSTAPTGYIGMSGANLVFFNGSNWVIVTAA